MLRVIFLGLPCWQAGCMARAVKQPVVLMKWYRVVSWMLDRVDSFRSSPYRQPKCARPEAGSTPPIPVAQCDLSGHF